MLATLYRGVIRLHPPAFREKFGDEMLSIFERAQGMPTAMWLFFDALVSLARQWGLRSEFWRGLDPAEVQPAHDGIPTFTSLDPFRPRSAAVIEGLVLSTTIFCLTCFAIRYSWIHVLHVRIPEVQFERPTWTPDNRNLSTSVSIERALPNVQERDRARIAPSDTPPAANNSIPAPPARPVPAKTKSRQRTTEASLDAALPKSMDATTTSDEKFLSTVENQFPLQTFEGTYMVESPRKLAIVVTREGGNLAMRMAKRPRLALIPVSQMKFAVSGMAECWIDFVPNRDSGDHRAPSELKLSCNGEQLVAHRQ